MGISWGNGNHSNLKKQMYSKPVVVFCPVLTGLLASNHLKNRDNF